MTEPTGRATGPTLLRWAVGLLAVEAVAVAAVTVFLIYADIAAAPTDPRNAWTVTGFAFAATALLAALCRALLRRRAWARGPAIVLEMMLLPIGYYMIRGGVPWLGVPVLIVGLVGAGLLLAPATRETLGIR